MNQNPKRVLKPPPESSRRRANQAFNESKPEEGTETLYLKCDTTFFGVHSMKSKPEEGTETLTPTVSRIRSLPINESKPEEGTETVNQESVY